MIKIPWNQSHLTVLNLRDGNWSTFGMPWQRDIFQAMVPIRSFPVLTLKAHSAFNFSFWASWVSILHGCTSA